MITIEHKIETNNISLENVVSLYEISLITDNDKNEKGECIRNYLVAHIGVTINTHHLNKVMDLLRWCVNGVCSSLELLINNRHCPSAHGEHCVGLLVFGDFRNPYGGCHRSGDNCHEDCGCDNRRDGSCCNHCAGSSCEVPFRDVSVLGDSSADRVSPVVVVSWGELTISFLRKYFALVVATLGTQERFWAQCRDCNCSHVCGRVCIRLVYDAHGDNPQKHWEIWDCFEDLYRASYHHDWLGTNTFCSPVSLLCAKNGHGEYQSSLRQRIARELLVIRVCRAFRKGVLGPPRLVSPAGGTNQAGA